jgi:hypothetical protein
MGDVNADTLPRGGRTNMVDKADSDRVELLRDYLRQPENRVGKEHSAAEHQNALSGIWAEAMRLSNGDVYTALEISLEAVKSGQQPNETHAEYMARLDGIPAKAFGLDSAYGGVDKAQHFFAAAKFAYTLSTSEMESNRFMVDFSRPSPISGERMARWGGRAYEVGDQVGKSVSGGNPTGYSQGDVLADDRGAAFGAALSRGVTDPLVPDTSGSNLDLGAFLPDPATLPGEPEKVSYPEPENVSYPDDSELPLPDDQDQVSYPEPENVSYPEPENVSSPEPENASYPDDSELPLPDDQDQVSYPGDDATAAGPDDQVSYPGDDDGAAAGGGEFAMEADAEARAHENEFNMEADAEARAHENDVTGAAAGGAVAGPDDHGMFPGDDDGAAAGGGGFAMEADAEARAHENEFNMEADAEARASENADDADDG